MKTLKTLIRLQKDVVDKLKKELAQIQERQQALIDERENLSRQLEHESEVATKFPEAAAPFAAFAKKTLDRQKLLTRDIEMLQRAIDKKRDDLQAEYGEQKKFEIALEQRQLAELAEIKRKEAIKMDEVALRGYIRKDE